MKIELTEQQYRYLLDLVYIGNWVINSTREDDRIKEYDQVESLVFSHCLRHRMSKLVELYQGELIPSRAFADGGIHEAIENYEDIVFYEILAEELALGWGRGSVRIDTHPGNLPMQRMLEKQGYKKCGIIRICGGSEDGAVRIALEKVLS